MVIIWVMLEIMNNEVFSNNLKVFLLDLNPD